MKALGSFLLALSLWISLVAAAASETAKKPLVTVAVDKSSVLVGQMNTVKIKVLVPTWFTKPIYFDEVEALNLINVKTEKSAYPVSEQIDYETWSGVIKEYTVIAMTEGKFALSPPPLKIHYMGDDGKPAEAVIDVPPVSFTALVPAQAKSLNPLIIASDLSLTQIIEQPEKLVVGQSISRKVTAVVTGTSALFIPDLLTDQDNDAIQSYRQQPQVKDVTDRDGEVTGQRTDQQDILLKAPGTLVLPAITLGYYNPETDSVLTASVPEKQFDIVAGPASVRIWSLRILAALLLLIALIMLMKKCLAQWRAYQHSEVYLFRRLRRHSARANRQFLHELQLWHNQWRAAYTGSGLKAAFHNIVIQAEEAVYRQVKPVPSLRRQLTAHRAALKATLGQRAYELNSLNP